MKMENDMAKQTNPGERIDLIEKLFILSVVILNIIGSLQHFFYHIEFVKYSGQYQKFIMVLNIMYGFIFLYIALGIYFGNRYQRHTFILFNLLWWVTTTCVFLSIMPDITTLSLVRKYIPLPFQDIICIILFFCVQIGMSAYLVYKGRNFYKLEERA